MQNAEFRMTEGKHCFEFFLIHSTFYILNSSFWSILGQMKQIIAFGHHDQKAPRHWNIRRILESEGFDVIECHTQKKGHFAKCRDLKSQFREKAGDAEALLVTFPGHYLVPLAWRLTRRPRRKLIFDAFLSLFDTLVSDRKKYSHINPFSWFLYLVDMITMHLADEVWIDTEEHKKFLTKKFFLKPDRIRVVYLGTRDDLFFPKGKAGNEILEILFYGTYIPLQGVEYILEAAKILKVNPRVRFTLIGSGQTGQEMRDIAKKNDLNNVTFIDRVPFETLPDLIRGADLCLGIFGTSGKAKRVIPHKVYDAVACGVPVLTADTPAIREKFTDGKEVILCKAGNGEAIAEKIATLLP